MRPRIRVQFGQIVRRKHLQPKQTDNYATHRVSQLRMQDSVGLQLRDANKSVPTEGSPPQADLQKTYRESKAKWDYTVKPSPPSQSTHPPNTLKVYAKSKMGASNKLPSIQHSKI